jgi:AraC-like DNA-binding protein
MSIQLEHVIFNQSINDNWSVPLGPTRHHILFIVLRGKVHYYVDGQSIVLEKGEGLFMPKGVMRSAEADAADPHLMFSAHFLGGTEEELSILADEPFKWIRPIGFDYLKQRFSELYECWIGKMPCYQLISHGILLEILGIIQRELSSRQLASSKRNLALRVQHYIVKHYREQLRLSDLSREAERTPNYISSVFKEVTGYTPIEYMHLVRIAAARELMLTTQMTIGEIAEYLGYCDQTYFNYMYKKTIGQPPSAILKEAD